MTTLYVHQSKFLFQNPDKSALIWSCGTGKTITAIEWSRMRKSFTTLIICPKSLKQNWRNEVGKLHTHPENYRVMTKEEFSKEAATLPSFGQVVVDECHIGFLTPNFKSDMSKALKGYLRKYEVRRVLLLTATPYTSNPWQIYNLAYYLGHKWNWNDFNRKFFDQVRFGPRIVPVAKKGCEVELAKIIKRIADVVDINDVLPDLPLQLHADPEYFALTTKQKTLIKEAYDPLPIVRFTREHIVEQDGDKVDRIKSLVEENPKVAIVCRYIDQMDALAGVLKAYKPLMIRGDVPNRHEVCEKAEKAKKAVVLIQADSVEGYELPSFPLVVFASMSYSYAKKVQLEGRFLRVNKPSRTTFLYLLTDGDSVDSAIYQAVSNKKDFQIELFKKTK